MKSIRQKYADSPEFQKIRKLAYPEPTSAGTCIIHSKIAHVLAFFSLLCVRCAGSGLPDISKLDIRVGHIVSAEKVHKVDIAFV